MRSRKKVGISKKKVRRRSNRTSSSKTLSLPLMDSVMESPSLPRDVSDINVCLLSAKKKSASSPSLRQLDQMSLCSFPTSFSMAEELASLGDQPLPKSKGRGRKRTRDYDTQSVQDFSIKEPSSKKRRQPFKFSSLANKIIDSPLKQASKSIKRSLSFSKDPSTSAASKYRTSSSAPSTSQQSGTPKHAPSRQRSSRQEKKELSNPTLVNSAKKKKGVVRSQLPGNWVELVADSLGEYSKEEVKRQEAIYSIYRTETEMVEDLRMIINIFFHPLLRLNLISPQEHCKIFGNVQTILSLHEDLVSKLEELRSSGETIEAVGKTVLQWSETLSPYADYCANLVSAKQTLEAKKQEPSFQDFLQRCLESDFSRKIELWTFLDSPRSRIMKYPILLKEVRKKTADGHADIEDLEKAMSSFDVLIKEVDRRTGMAKCRDVISRLDYLHDDQHCQEIDESQFILCSGVLRNKNNSKLHVFLFDKVLVLTRPSSRTGVLLYQVYRQPIPLTHLSVEDVTDGEGKIMGSFRGAKSLKSSGGNPGFKHMFRVTCTDPQITRHAHTLQANGDYDKKAWLDAFRSVVTVTTSVPQVTVV